ncbi:MAG: hypothetical protein ACD_60C00029G0016 [uncultured bacterium]|nr:MAG: hypothetical protein ACD_60C00029G0016 [uncultured bacterium]
MQIVQCHNKYFLAMLVLLVIPISGLSIDIYVPSLPAVSHYFGADKALAQLTVTSYMMGLSVMQIFGGSISDSFGRRNPFLISMFIYIAVTLWIPFAHSIQELLWLRLFQGMAVAVTVVPMRSVISDLFEGREFYKMTNYMTMAWSIGPIVAPAIGGYLQYYFNWQASFYFLSIYSGLIFLLMLIFLPETSQHRHSFRLVQIFLRYKQILFHKEYAAGLIINGMLYSFIVLFSIVGPFLIQTVLHYSAIEFGHIALLMGLAWFLGMITNRFFIDVPLAKKTKLCFWIVWAIILLMLCLTYLFPLNIYNIVIPIFFLLWVGSIVFPSYFARNMALFPHISGSANALFGASVFFIAGINSAFGTLLKSTSEIPLAIAYFVIINICLIVYYLDNSNRLTP